MLNPSQVGVDTDIGSRVVILWSGDLKNKKVMVRRPFLSSGGERLSSWYISSSDSEGGGK